MIKNEVLFIIDENREFLFDGVAFKEAPTKPKGYSCASVINSEDIRTYGFKTPKNTSDEKVEIQAEMKMYEEGGLDSEIDFSISSLTVALEHDDSNFIESYAVETSTLETTFSDIAKKHGELSFLFPAAISYQSLYTSELLEKKNDLFIHLGDESSFAVIFKEGHYISTRTIPTLSEIGEKIGGIDASAMREILSTKGVLDELYTPDEFLKMTDTQEELSKIVERIAHAIGHKRGVFKLETIDRIFLDFEACDIPGFLELFNSYGYEESAKEALDLFESVDVGMKHYAINALYALGAVEEKANILNLTIFQRQPAFIKTHVGQFSMVLLLAIILSGLYPAYAMYTLQNLEDEEKSLNASVKKMEQVTQKLSLKLKEKRVQRDELTKKKQNIIAEIRSYDSMINSLEDIDESIRSRQQMMKDVNIVMKKYKLSSKNMEIKESKYMNVQIITTYNQRDNIAEFIKELISQGYSHVQTKKVEKNETYYESFVEIYR